MDLFGDQIRHIAGYLCDLGADAGAICPVSRVATRKNKNPLVIFEVTSLRPFQPDSNPSVANLAFYQLLRSGPAGKATTVEDRCPFPFRILSEHMIHMKYYDTWRFHLNEDSAAGIRSRLLEHTVRSWEDFDFTYGEHHCRLSSLAYTCTLVSYCSRIIYCNRVSQDF